MTGAERGVPVSNNARCAVVKMRHCSQSFKKKGRENPCPSVELRDLRKKAYFFASIFFTAMLSSFAAPSTTTS